MALVIPDAGNASYMSKCDQVVGAAKDILWQKLQDYSVGEWLEIWLYFFR